MKKIIFENLSIKNFLSVGNKPVIINFKAGLHAITGKNLDQIDRRNGVGKSTIPDALHFALFGTTIRELKKEFIINNITGDTCEIKLKFKIINNKKEDTYEIIRTLEPSKCLLFHNNHDVTRDSIANTTEYIAKLIHSSPEIFQNCVIMSVNSTVPFMAQKKTDKRKFIEGIFNLEVFSRMISQLREEQSSIKKELEIEINLKDETEKLLDNLTKQKEKAHKDYEIQLETLTNRKEKINIEILKLNDQIEKYQPLDVKNTEQNIVLLSQKIKDCDDKIQELGKQVATFETKNEYVLASLNKVGTDKDTCPVCLKPITSHDSNIINTHKKKLNEEIDKYEQEIKLLEEKILEHNTLKLKINDAIKKGQNAIQQFKLLEQQHINNKDQINKLNQQIINVNNDLQHLTDSSSTLDNVILDSKKKLDETSTKVEQLRRAEDLLNTVKFVTSEEGVKSFIVKQILKLFNSKLSYYLKKLNSNAIISFNEYFEEQVFNLKGKITSYFNFSGAERKVIDLAIMFTFIEMLQLQSNLYYNIQFYDELLDTSLDETGVELVVGLLNEFVEKNKFGIYIISHRKECSRLCTGGIIFLEKRNGITTLAAHNQIG